MAILHKLWERVSIHEQTVHVTSIDVRNTEFENDEVHILIVSIMTCKQGPAKLNHSGIFITLVALV